MAKTGRNAPCPCGSGKKYKKCCLAKDQAAKPQNRPAPVIRSAEEKEAMLRAMMHPDAFCEEDLIDDYSNIVVDLINNRDFDGAEQACKELEQKFPDFIDCPMRRAMLCEAKGEYEQAIAHYERCLELIAEDPMVYECPEDFEESIEQLREKIAAGANPGAAVGKES